MTFILIYFLKVNPEFLVRRMQFREKEREQSLIVKLTWIPLLLTFLLPGFDVRLGWSKVPTGIVIAADAMVFIGYAFVFLVFRKNNFASRIVEVTENQKVIDSGPYALVRHPMYSGTILMYTLSPLALGSYWAILPALCIIPLLIMRIFNEEKVLARDLPGYTEYMQKVRWRLIPGIW
jgi:protein-S-isoprenylcysteine O-methyltransferase Ste14